MFSRFGCQFEAGACVVASVLRRSHTARFFPLASRHGDSMLLTLKERLDPENMPIEISKWKGPHSSLCQYLGDTRTHSPTRTVYLSVFCHEWVAQFPSHWCHKVRLLSVLDPTGMLEFLLEIAAGAIARP